MRRVAVLALAVTAMSLGCRFAPKPDVDSLGEGASNVTIHYLEIVSEDMDALCTMYERLHGLWQR